MRVATSRRIGRACAVLALALVGAGPVADQAAAKGAGTMAASGGVAVEDSPYRYFALDPRMPGAPTMIERIDRRGGRIDHWWYLPGDYFVPAVAYDGSGGGLSADGSTLVLGRLTHRYPVRETRFAVLDTELRLRHPYRSRADRAERALTRIDVPGFHGFHAISPDGSTAYLVEFVSPRQSIADFEVRALDLESGKLRPGPVSERGRRPWMQGLPIAHATSGDGRWAYTLFDGNGGVPFLLALDTVAGETTWLDLPQLKERHSLFLTQMRLAEEGRKIVLSHDSRVEGEPASPPRLAIDTRTFAIWTPATGRGDFLDFAEAPRRPGNLLSRLATVGRSSQGRPINLWQFGDPAWSGELLVFGCIHGDECAARKLQPVPNGAPDPSADVYVVPNLNPDGRRAGSRLNGHGVDLNRNFASEWRPIGSRWDPQHSGPKPFSEPETRLAARIVRALRPEATIWFHQYRGSRPFVRAWGQSAAPARRFARLARMPFRLLRWPAGTAPNWQNHRFRGAGSFVVELPRGELGPALRSRLAKAVLRMGRSVRED